MGYELITEANLLTEASRVAVQAMEKVTTPPVQSGNYDLILDPEHLSLTIHESCGHPSELDRALGYFCYGSPQVTLVVDNTEPGTLAATGYDDDGVACQQWDIVQNGLFVGYCTNREVSPKVGESRSRGSNRADSWGSVPIVRIANIGLVPGEGQLDQTIADVKRGIYIEGHDSFSIDQQRYNLSLIG